jgi:hypothetical protein
MKGYSPGSCFRRLMSSGRQSGAAAVSRISLTHLLWRRDWSRETVWGRSCFPNLINPHKLWRRDWSRETVWGSSCFPNLINSPVLWRREWSRETVWGSSCFLNPINSPVLWRREWSRETVWGSSCFLRLTSSRLLSSSASSNISVSSESLSMTGINQCRKMPHSFFVCALISLVRVSHFAFRPKLNFLFFRTSWDYAQVQELLLKNQRIS